MYEIKKEENMKIFARLHAGEKRDIGVEEGQREKNEDEEMSLTLTMCERQVHWYGCNALSIRLVNHVASIPICPWYHLPLFLSLASLFAFLSVCLMVCLFIRSFVSATPSGRNGTSLSQPGSNSRL